MLPGGPEIASREGGPLAGALPSEQQSHKFLAIGETREWKKLRRFGDESAHRYADQGVEATARALPGRYGAPVRIQGSTDRLGNGDRHTADHGVGAAACRGEVRRAVRLLHRSFPARRRGLVLLATDGRRPGSDERIREDGRTVDRCIPHTGGAGGAEGAADAAR